MTAWMHDALQKNQTQGRLYLCLLCLLGQRASAGCCVKHLPWSDQSRLQVVPTVPLLQSNSSFCVGRDKAAAACVSSPTKEAPHSKCENILCRSVQGSRWCSNRPGWRRCTGWLQTHSGSLRPSAEWRASLPPRGFSRYATHNSLENGIESVLNQ